MIFVKKFLFGIGAVLLILWGGAGTQSKNVLLQGGGFIGLLIGLVVLYLFLKMAWRAMGCLPSFLIFSGISLFILYAIGAFNGGIGNMGANLKSFLGQKPQPQRQMLPPGDFSEPEGLNGDDETAGDKIGSFVDNISEKFGSAPRRTVPSISAYPLIRSSARVVNGDTLKIQGFYFRLYGIDAPDSDQTCADKNKRSYKCGLKAATWLRDWILDYELECRVMQRDQRGNMAGVCFLGEYDLGAALVASGWALAAAKYTDIYVPYEQEARRNKNGLWSGTFYRPEDWRILKAQKPDIKIIKPKIPRKKAFGGSDERKRNFRSSDNG